MFARPASLKMPWMALIATSVVLLSACAHAAAVPIGTPEAQAVEHVGDFTMVGYSRRARPGGFVFVRIQTRPGALCTISLTLPNGVWLQNFALAPQRADANGLCTWAVRLPADTPLGVAHFTVAAQGSATRYTFLVTAP